MGRGGGHAAERTTLVFLSISSPPLPPIPSRLLLPGSWSCVCPLVTPLPVSFSSLSLAPFRSPSLTPPLLSLSLPPPPLPLPPSPPVSSRRSCSPAQGAVAGPAHDRSPPSPFGGEGDGTGHPGACEQEGDIGHRCASFECVCVLAERDGLFFWNDQASKQRTPPVPVRVLLKNLARGRRKRLARRGRRRLGEEREEGRGVITLSLSCPSLPLAKLEPHRLCPFTMRFCRPHSLLFSLSFRREKKGRTSFR